MAFGFGENNSKLILVGAEDGQAQVCHVGMEKGCAPFLTLRSTGKSTKSRR
jgi:hypothetical protein